MIIIDVEISERDADILKVGGGTMTPLNEEIFLKTVGGYISIFEVMMMAFNRFGRRFRISLEELPYKEEIKPNKMRAAFMNDSICPDSIVEAYNEQM